MTDRDDSMAAEAENSEWQRQEMQEANPEVFESGRPSSRVPVPPDEQEMPTAVMGPGGDSRPDRQDPGGFVRVDGDLLDTTTRAADEMPEIRHEDPDFLAQHRVDQDDQIEARYAGHETEAEVAVLRPAPSSERDAQVDPTASGG